MLQFILVLIGVGLVVGLLGAGVAPAPEVAWIILIVAGALAIVTALAGFWNRK